MVGKVGISGRLITVEEIDFGQVKHFADPFFSMNCGSKLVFFNSSQEEKIVSVAWVFLC